MKGVTGLIKKIIAVTLAAVICLLASSCSIFTADEPVLNISGAQIDKCIYAYYFDKVVANPENFSLKKDASPSEIADKAVELCVRYVAVNTMFVKYNLHLTTSQKTEISANVGTLWTCYGNHYKKIGVTREAISRIETNSMYEDTIFTRLFDSTDEDAEKKVKKYFAENYIIFRAVCGYFTTTDAAGSEMEMNDSQKSAVEKSFREASKKTTDIAALEQTAAALGYTASSTILLKKSQCEGYPDGFFESVNKMNNNSCGVLKFDDCIFLIWKYNPQEREEEYATCRSQCVKDMYSAYGEASFKSLEDTFEITRSEAMINSFINNIELYG